MPFYEKGEICIHYEEAGSGCPLFIIPGGGLNANISKFNESHPFNPMTEFQGEYRCIALDLRGLDATADLGVVGGGVVRLGAVEPKEIVTLILG